MEYSKLFSEVQGLIYLVNNDPEMKQKPTGWRIMYSPIIPKAKVLLMGINPGAGMKNVTIDYPNPQLEYLNNLEYNYKLAGQTVELFRRIGKFDVLEQHTAKTNIHYYVSKGMTDFRKIFWAIDDIIKSNSGGSKDYLSLSYSWNKAMIYDIIDPQVIICEGKGAYDYVLGLMAQSIELKVEENWDGFCGLHKAGDKWILGYSRRYSDIKNINRVAAVLERIL